MDAIGSSPCVSVVRVPDDAEDEAWERLRHRDDREYSFVDATSFAVMRRRRLREVLAGVPAGSLMITLLHMTETPSLFQWAGGAGAFRRLIDAFYDRVERDDLLSPLFPGGVSEDHRAHVTLWWVEVFGGPAGYTDQLGGYERMLAHHRGLAITEQLRDRFTALMRMAADDAALPTDPEFRAAFVGYLEWGTRLALENSQTDAAVAEHAPVPRWGWGVAPPYQP